MKHWYFFAFFTSIFFLYSCKQPQSFEFREMKDLQIKHLGISKSVVSMNLVFYNPNNMSINLKNIDCEVFFNEKYLGDYKLDTLIHISGKSTFMLPASIHFDMLDIFKKGISTIMNREALISVKGTTKVGKSIFYKNLPIQYEMRYRLPI